jgi:putative flippase GtrA
LDVGVTRVGGRTFRPLFGDAARYLLAGGLITLFYLGLYALLLWAGVHYFVAILCAQAVTIAIAFPAYRRFVFGPGPSLLRDLLKFLSVWIGGAIAGLIVTPLLVELLSWNPFLGQVLAIVVVTMANFVVHRFWTFAPGRRSAPDARDTDHT